MSDAPERKRRNRTHMLRELHRTFDENAPRHMPLTARRNALAQLLAVVEEAATPTPTPSTPEKAQEAPVAPEAPVTPTEAPTARQRRSTLFGARRRS